MFQFDFAKVVHNSGCFCFHRQMEYTACLKSYRAYAYQKANDKINHFFAHFHRNCFAPIYSYIMDETEET